MTAEADIQRNRRQAFAAPGSPLDRMVACSRSGCRWLVGVIAALMIITPLSPRGEVSFLLDRNKVAIDETACASTTRCTAGGRQGRPFSLLGGRGGAAQRQRPGRAHARSRRPHLLAQGPAVLQAEAGRYDFDAETVAIDSQVTFTAADGYRMTARGVSINLRDKTLVGSNGVEGRFRPALFPPTPCGPTCRNGPLPSLATRACGWSRGSCSCRNDDFPLPSPPAREAGDATHAAVPPRPARSLCRTVRRRRGNVLTLGSTAGAQSIAGFNSNQPVNYAADRIELQDRQNRVVLSGDVVITQGDLRLTAARTTVAYSDAGTLRIQRIDATGGVTVTRGNERASGAAGVYDFNRRVIVLSGGVALRRGGDTLNGGRLTIDLDSGLASVDGGGAGTATPGRVSGTFTVPGGKISLPDGSVREVPPGTTPADVAAAIGPGLAKAALAARVDGELARLGRPFEGDASWRSSPRATRPTRSSWRGTITRMSSPKRCRRCSRARRSPSARRPTTASITTSRPPAGRGPFTEEDLPRSRRRCARSSRADKPLRREVWSRDAADREVARRRRDLQGRVGRRAARGRGADRLLGGEATGSTCAAGRTCQHRQARSAGVQADAGVGRLLARRPEERAAHAHLRHRLAQQEAARCASPPAGGSGQARPPQAGRRRWTCSTCSPKRTGSVFWHPKGYLIWRELEAYMRRGSTPPAMSRSRPRS
jgi:lipopolysaccharide export system protein LptA